MADNSFPWNLLLFPIARHLHRPRSRRQSDRCKQLSSFLANSSIERQRFLFEFNIASKFPLLAEFYRKGWDEGGRFSPQLLMNFRFILTISDSLVGQKFVKNCLKSFSRSDNKFNVACLPSRASAGQDICGQLKKNTAANLANTTMEDYQWSSIYRCLRS